MGHNQSIFRTILHLKDTPFLAHDHDPRPMLLRNHYGVDMGTSGLVIQVQSRKEIFVDKLIAFALQPNRLKNRDLWDMGWLKHIGITLPLELLPKKLKDHRFHKENFLDVYPKRLRFRCTEHAPFCSCPLLVRGLPMKAVLWNPRENSAVKFNDIKCQQ